MQLLRGHESSLLNLFERYGTMETEQDRVMMMCQSDACRFADDFDVSRFVRRQCLLSSELHLVGEIASSRSGEDHALLLIQSQIRQIFFGSWRSYMIDRAVDEDKVKMVLDFDCFVEFCGRIAIALYISQRSDASLSGHAPDIAIDIVKSFLEKLNKGSVHLTDDLFDVSSMFLP